jgi:hypothetical protein
MVAGDGGGKEWREEVAGRVATRAGGKHGGVNGRGRRYGQKIMGEKCQDISLIINLKIHALVGR